MTPLHWIGDFFREQLLAIPLPVVRGIFLAVPLTLLVWVLRLPNSVTTPPGEPRRLVTNLKTWAALSLLAQILIYSLL